MRPARTRDIPTILFAIPIVLSLVVALYALATGRVDLDEAISLALFVVGPAIVLAGHQADSTPLIVTGVTLYVVQIGIWSLSWGGLHLVVGMTAMVVGLVVRGGRRFPYNTS